jgi:hypothetical protein
VTTGCSAPATAAFAFVADVGRLGSWALGCWDAQPADEGLVRGTSLFDGSATYVRADADPERLAVDFAVGPEPQLLVRRLSARVLAGEPLGFGDGTSLVTLTAWRPEAMSDARWAQLVASHEAEILLLRARIEGAAGAPGGGRRDD